MEVLFVIVLWFISRLEERSYTTSKESKGYRNPKNSDHNIESCFFNYTIKSTEQ